MTGPYKSALVRQSLWRLSDEFCASCVIVVSTTALLCRILPVGTATRDRKNGVSCSFGDAARRALRGQNYSMESAVPRTWRRWPDVAELFAGPADPAWGADREAIAHEVAHFGREVVGVDDGEALAELVRAHADLERVTEESADARERRRRAARRLLDTGHSMTWIAAQLGVTRQAVDGFLKYKDRKRR